MLEVPVKPTALLLLMSLVLHVGCDSSEEDQIPGRALSPPSNLDPNQVPVTEGTWYRPGTDVTWQWQLRGPINTTYAVDLYDVDLFDAPAAVIDTLHQQNRRVFCHFSAGSARNDRPDFDAFLNTDLGRTVAGIDSERWLDIRSQNVLDLMLARLDLAVARGCDGIEPDHVDAYIHDTGFDLTEADQRAYNQHLANEAHRRGLSVALKNNGALAAAWVDYFDLVLNEECHVNNACAAYQIFLAQGKPVLNAEYAATASQAESMRVKVCPQTRFDGLQTLILPLNLDDAFRVSCP